MVFSLIAGRSNAPLAANIAKRLGAEFVPVEIRDFPSKEIAVKLSRDASEHVLIAQSLSFPAAENIMELLLLADAARRRSAKLVTAIVPYFGYGRQDRISKHNDAIAAEVVIKTLRAAGIDKIITLDIHSGLLGDYLESVEATPVFQHVATHVAPELIVSPDEGSAGRALRLGDLTGREVVVLQKLRYQEGGILHKQVNTNVAGKKCLIIDDIIDTGATILSAAATLKQNGASGIFAAATHAVISNDAASILQQSDLIETIYVTDSILQTNLPSKFQILPCEGVIARYCELTLQSRK